MNKDGRQRSVRRARRIAAGLPGLCLAVAMLAAGCSQSPQAVARKDATQPAGSSGAAGSGSGPGASQGGTAAPAHGSEAEPKAAPATGSPAPGNAASAPAPPAAASLNGGGAAPSSAAGPGSPAGATAGSLPAAATSAASAGVAGVAHGSEAEPKSAAIAAAPVGAGGVATGAGSTAGTAAAPASVGKAANGGAVPGASPAAGPGAGPAAGAAPADTVIPIGAGAKRGSGSDPSVVIVDGPDTAPDSQLSLADAAKAERERKAEATPPRIVINDKTLHSYAKKGQITVADPKKKGAAGAAAKATPAGAAAAAGAGAAGATAADTAQVRDESYWRGRALEIRQRWRKAAERIKGLESDVSEWRRRFYAQDDPWVRDGQIKPAWDHALEDLRAARAEAQVAKKELVDFMEEGRAAGALPGWLREGIDLEPKEEKPVDPTKAIETPIYKDNGR